MPGDQKVRYLKIDRGRYFYQRRVPKNLQGPLNQKFWRRPCGDVDYSKAVQLVVTWAEEHDQLIQDLRDPGRLDQARNLATREWKTRLREGADALGLPRFLEMSEQRPGEKKFFPLASLPRPWQAAAKMMADADATRSGHPPLDGLLKELAHRVWLVQHEMPETDTITVPNYGPITEYLDGLEPRMREAIRVEVGGLPEPLGDLDYLDWLREAYFVGFGPECKPPDDPDDRDEYDFIKRKLERKISELEPDPNTITRVAERYFDFNAIRPNTRSKYRRDVGRLVKMTGDVPLSHVTTGHLRGLRDTLMVSLKPASVQAVFTPIIGLFSFAIEEEIIGGNPLAAVKLPRDKRPIEERKWKKFEPTEVRRILAAIDDIWGQPVRGLSDERRNAIRMVVRALAFSGMRPIEVLRLTAHDVEDHLIRIRGSKTESSTRVIPLHHEISDLPDWVRRGGLKTFSSIKTDPVSSVRHNFERLIREWLPQPILDRQKVLYSFRSSFVNAMRRAGADIQVRRAILGHKEAGAIRHYDDGPEFEIKNKWVQATDPRQTSGMVPDRDEDDF